MYLALHRVQWQTSVRMVNEAGPMNGWGFYGYVILLEST
jgi:hypothetical protein